MLLDEPTSNLDILHQIEVMEMIKDLIQEKKITVVSVLHDLNVASLYSDAIILLHQGEIFAMGSPEDIITQKNIKEVYGIDVFIMMHPLTERPQIVHWGRGNVG
jgi:iron complex transport system ATP-binding protein